MRNETRHYRTKVKRAKKYVDPLLGAEKAVNDAVKAMENKGRIMKATFGGSNRTKQ